MGQLPIWKTGFARGSQSVRWKWSPISQRQITLINVQEIELETFSGSDDCSITSLECLSIGANCGPLIRSWMVKLVQIVAYWLYLLYHHTMWLLRVDFISLRSYQKHKRVCVVLGLREKLWERFHHDNEKTIVANIFLTRINGTIIYRFQLFEKLQTHFYLTNDLWGKKRVGDNIRR